ncbi:hypothetical protein [Rhizobium terrae]|uniref:hypothetical protein n=1 Tax=Rhizobium terrae TaxID=2171756 RepID=UPI000E3D3A46|nr:hypothetical protein [Rhizobium terrae]
MLPPVRATLSSFVDYQAQPQAPLLRQRIDVTANAASTETIASAPLSGGRLDILSLSAQLQLAQGFSIFAETIGKLIKLPRREGEALLEYARRLLEAVKVMNPAERQALERALNQLVKGMSLRLLTEVLNNPSGPNAARLAMRLETAQLLDRDLAAKAVVSSYRQNAGAEQALNLPPRAANATPAAPAPGNAGRTAAAAAGQPAPQAKEPVPADDTEHGNPPATAAGEADTPPSASETEVTEPAFSAVSQNTELEAADAGETGQEAVPPATPAGPDAPQGETPELDAAMSDEAPENAAATGDFEAAEHDIRSPLNSDRRMAVPVFYDGPALARLSQREVEPSRSATAQKMAVPALTEWLADVFAEGGDELLTPLPAAARTLPEQQALEELMDHAPLTKPGPDNEQMREAARQAGQHAISEPEDQSAPSRTGNISPNPAGQAGSAASSTELAEQLALPLPLPPVLREGVPFPYVAYPPEERERDPEERKTRAISATDEDGEQQHSAGEQSFGEEASGEDRKGEPEDEASDEDKQEADRANDLYWRMAGWT